MARNKSQLKTQEEFMDTFNRIIKQVIEAVSDRAKKLLQEHINMDTYGINKTTTDKPSINKDYLNETGIPSYEFRDVAWDISVEGKVNQVLFKLLYNGLNMSAPSAESPLLHGNFDKNKDRRKELAEILNVSGVAEDADTKVDKVRSPFWDDFINELKQKLGGWLYTEFNNKGIDIPELKNAKF